MLTASTSESYAVLFKLLADQCDDVLVPRPSYPLFEHLTRLELVVPRSYDLEYHGVWSIDFDSLERAWTTRTRAVLIVSPNNPTGSFVKRDELDRLAAMCANGTRRSSRTRCSPTTSWSPAPEPRRAVRRSRRRADVLPRRTFEVGPDSRRSSLGGSPWPAQRL